MFIVMQFQIFFFASQTAETCLAHRCHGLATADDSSVRQSDAFCIPFSCAIFLRPNANERRTVPLAKCCGWRDGG